MTLDLTQRWTVIEGDCLDVMRQLPDGCVDAVVTDPPYSSGGMVRGDRTPDTGEKYVHADTELVRPSFGGDSRDQRSYLAWCYLWLSECMRVTKAGGVLLSFTDWRQLPTLTDAVQVGGWIWRGVVVWDKRGGIPQRGRFRAQSEFIVWASNGVLEPDRGVPVLDGVFTHTVAQSDKHHQTGKPTALMRDVVRICSPGGLILDPFAGSGTTGLGALAGGYRFLGIEREPAYVAIARRRIADAAAQGSLFDPVALDETRAAE
jgi:site-specific DNA-methyltransferase (adenine-specific)